MIRKKDELRHRLGQPAGYRSQGDDDQRQHEQRLAPENIAQPSENHNGRRSGEQITAAHPGIKRQAIEHLRHAGQGGGDDGGVERHQDDRGGDARHGQEQFSAGAP